MTKDKVVLKFLDGRLIRGYLRDFSETSDELSMLDSDTDGVRIVRSDELKAIFYVRSFEGDRLHHEKKSYGMRKQGGHRVFIKFSDGEDMVGFLEGEMPWDKGFFLNAHPINNRKGFFLLPADGESNNIKVFIFAGAVQDVTVVP